MLNTTREYREMFFQQLFTKLATPMGNEQLNLSKQSLDFPKLCWDQTDPL